MGNSASSCGVSSTNQPWPAAVASTKTVPSSTFPRVRPGRSATSNEMSSKRSATLTSEEFSQRATASSRIMATCSSVRAADVRVGLSGKPSSAFIVGTGTEDWKNPFAKWASRLLQKLPVAGSLGLPKKPWAVIVLPSIVICKSPTVGLLSILILSLLPEKSSVSWYSIYRESPGGEGNVILNSSSASI